MQMFENPKMFKEKVEKPRILKGKLQKLMIFGEKDSDREVDIQRPSIWSA